MKILVISDSHGRNTYLERVMKQVGPLDLLIHLGDLEGSEHFIQNAAACPVEMVSGNNDYFSDIEREKQIQIGKYSVLLTHGHRYRVNYGLEDIKEYGRECGADIVMFGHTHIPCIDQADTDIIAVNPGSISQPRQEGHRPTYIIMELDRMGEVHFSLNYVN